MKVFVSGASGFIGRAVVSNLSKRGHEVTGLAKGEAGSKVISSAGGRAVIGDLMKGGEWCSEVASSDKVISLSQPFDSDDIISIDKMEGLGRLHAEEVTNLIKAAGDTGSNVKGIVVTYHTNCYGERNGKWVEADAGAVDPIGFCRPLTGSFDTIERVVEDSGIPTVTVFPAMVYGNGGWFTKLVADIVSGNARIVKPGNNYLNVIHVDDVAELYSLIVEKMDKSDVVTMSDSRPVMQYEFIGLLASLLDKSIPKMVEFKEYEKAFGLMAAEAMSSSTKTSADRLLGMFNYNCMHKSYESGILYTLKSMGIEPMAKAA